MSDAFIDNDKVATMITQNRGFKPVILDQGCVMGYAHSTSMASPVVLVAKKDGTTHFCMDYRKLNASPTLPQIDDSLDQLADSCYFSKLDLASGYW